MTAIRPRSARRSRRAAGVWRVRAVRSVCTATALRRPLRRHRRRASPSREPDRAAARLAGGPARRRIPRLRRRTPRAVRHLEHWALWPVMATILTGPRKSGRSLLGRASSPRKTGGAADRRCRAADEETLFHAWNRAQDDRRPLLIVADAPPPEWRSRCPICARASPRAARCAIGRPDDALMRRLFETQFARRGRRCAARADRLARPADRTQLCRACSRAVDVLDQAALARQQAAVDSARARHAACEAGVIDASEARLFAE